MSVVLTIITAIFWTYAIYMFIVALKDHDANDWPGVLLNVLGGVLLALIGLIALVASKNVSEYQSHQPQQYIEYHY